MHEVKDALVALTTNMNIGVYEGSKIIEVKNIGINKGAAAEIWLKGRSYDFVFGAGDDYTDEDMFGVLPEYAYSLKLGQGASRAKYQIDAPDSLRNLLAELADLIPPHRSMDNLNYGLIGNCKSAALVSETGSIDWCCLPDFDSSSFFAHLLDRDNGGYFSIEPVGDYRIEQQYLPRTNILVTRFSGSDDCFEVIDFMPRYKTEHGTYHCPPDILRYLRWICGTPRLRIHYGPRPGYAKHPVHQVVTQEFIKHYTVKGAYESIYLYSDLPLKHIAAGEPVTPGTALQDIVTAITRQAVICRRSLEVLDADERVARRIATDAAAAQQRDRNGPGGGGVVGAIMPSAAIDDIGAGAACERIVAVLAFKRIPAGTAE